MAAVRLAKLIRTERIEVLHLSETIPAAIGGAAGMLARRGVRIFHRHHTYIGGATIRLAALASRLAHLTVAVSKAVARAAESQDHVPRSKIFLAYNGMTSPRAVSQEEIRAAKMHIGIELGVPVVVIVGHLRPEKGHETLMKAVQALSGIHLVVAGGGTEESKLVSEAKALGIAERVHFMGHQQDVALWQRLADVIAVPSTREPFGLVAIEGMAAERPVIASAVDGLKEIVHDGDNGLLVAPNDVSGWTRAIRTVIQDQDLGRRLAVNGKRTFQERFTTAAMVRSWISAYSEGLRATKQ